MHRVASNTAGNSVSLEVGTGLLNGFQRSCRPDNLINESGAPTERSEQIRINHGAALGIVWLRTYRYCVETMHFRTAVLSKVQLKSAHRRAMARSNCASG